MVEKALQSADVVRVFSATYEEQTEDRYGRDGEATNFREQTNDRGDCPGFRTNHVALAEGQKVVSFHLSLFIRHFICVGHREAFRQEIVRQFV